MGGVMVSRLVFHLCCFHVAFVANPSKSVRIVKEHNKRAVQEIEVDAAWTEKTIAGLEQLLNETIETPPTRNRQRIQELSNHVNIIRTCAQNILTHIKERNETVSESLWASSASSASEAKQLAEEAASFTRNVVQELSEEKKEKAVDTIASHVKAQIASYKWRSSQFHNSQKYTSSVLIKASKDSLLEVSNLKSELRSFHQEARRKLEAMRKCAEVHINKTIKYLRLAENYSSSSEEIHSLYAPLEDIALVVKNEAISFAQKASQESLNSIQKMFDAFKGIDEKQKYLDDTIQDALNKTKSAHEETVSSWTRTNHDAMGVSKTFFKFTEVQSALEKAKSGIDKTKADVKKAKDNDKMKAIQEDVGDMSDSIYQVIRMGSDLSRRFDTYKLDIDQAMYCIWAQFYGYRAKRRMWRIKDHISSINHTNPVELLTKEDFEEAIKKWKDAKMDSQHVAEISLSAVEDATREMKQNVDLVQLLFHGTEAKAKAIDKEYREQLIIISREAEAILADMKLAIAAAVDEITRITTENYQKTKILVLEAQALRRRKNLLLLLGTILASLCVAALATVAYHRFCKKLPFGRHSYLADIKTEDDLLKLSKRQMKEVLEMSGVEIKENSHQEELMELLKQLWIHGAFKRTTTSLMMTRR